MAYKRNSIEVPELEILLAGKKKKYVRYAYRSGFLFCLFLSAVTHQALLVHILQYNIAARFFVHATFCRP